MSKELKPSDIDYILSLKPEDLTLTKFKELFANTKQSPARFETTDYFTLPANTLNNETSIRTTVGRYIFNLFMLTPKIIHYTGYINEVMDDKGIKRLDDKVSFLLLDDKITPQDFIDYVDKMQWMGFALNNFLVPSLNYDILEPIPEVIQRRDELIQKHIKAIEDGDAKVAEQIEKELLDLAKEKIQHLPSYDIYASGSRGSFRNNYKNTSIMRGAIQDNSRPGEFTISTANLIEGIPREDYDAYADLTVMASYSRAVMTRDGGYEAKKLTAAFQTVVLDEPGTDCGTRKTISVEITEKNKEDFLYRFLLKGSQHIMLTPEEIDKYVGKVVKLRSPMYCLGDKLCNYCAGDLYYRLGIRNIGLLARRIGTRMLNLALKSFHDTTVKFNRIKIDDYIS